MCALMSNRQMFLLALLLGFVGGFSAVTVASNSLSGGSLVQMTAG